MIDSFLSKFSKYGDVNKYDVLKSIAFLFMIIDHIGFFLLPQYIFIRVVGRVSMPIYVILFGMSCKKPDNLILLMSVMVIAMTKYFSNYFLPINLLLTMYLMSFLLDGAKNFYNSSKKIFIALLIILFPIVIITIYFIEYGLLILYLMLLGVFIKKDRWDVYDKITVATLYFITIVYYHYTELMQNVPYLCLFFLYFSGLVYYLIKNYKFLKNTVTIKNKTLKNAILISSRYSLYLYVFHLLMFNLLRKWLF
jgi:hypothetical protein